GAVVARAGDVVRIELDEALSPLAQQADGHQPHLALQLLLDLGDERGAALIVHAGDGGLGRAAGRAGLAAQALQRADFGAQVRDLIGVARGRLARGEETAQAEKDNGRKGEQQRRNETSWHWHSKFGSCKSAQRCVPEDTRPAAFIAWNNSLG